MRVPFRVESDEPALCTLARLAGQGVIRAVESAKRVPENRNNAVVKALLEAGRELAAVKDVRSALASLKVIGGISLETVEGAKRIESEVLRPCAELASYIGSYVTTMDMPDLTL